MKKVETMQVQPYEYPTVTLIIMVGVFVSYYSIIATAENLRHLAE